MLFCTVYSTLGWSEITFFVKLQVLTGRDGEMLKNMGSVKNLFINLKSETQWILKVQKKSQRVSSFFVKVSQEIKDMSSWGSSVVERSSARVKIAEDKGPRFESRCFHFFYLDLFLRQIFNQLANLSEA